MAAHALTYETTIENILQQNHEIVDVKLVNLKVKEFFLKLKLN